LDSASLDLLANFARIASYVAGCRASTLHRFVTNCDAVSPTLLLWTSQTSSLLVAQETKHYSLLGAWQNACTSRQSCHFYNNNDNAARRIHCMQHYRQATPGTLITGLEEGYCEAAVVQGSSLLYGRSGVASIMPPKQRSMIVFPCCVYTWNAIVPRTSAMQFCVVTKQRSFS